MRLLLDKNISPRVADLMTADGHEAALVAAVMPSASDREIVVRANDENCIVVTEVEPSDSARKSET